MKRIITMLVLGLAMTTGVKTVFARPNTRCEWKLYQMTKDYEALQEYNKYLTSKINCYELCEPEPLFNAKSNILISKNKITTRFCKEKLAQMTEDYEALQDTNLDLEGKLDDLKDYQCASDVDNALVKNLMVYEFQSCLLTSELQWLANQP